MANYPIKLKSLAIRLLHDSETINIADTAEDNKATRALTEFMNYGTMLLEDGKKVPYHAVQYVQVTETDAEIEKADPYSCVKSCC